MLPGLGFQEIVALAVLALLVVGPKDLPLMLRKLGRWTAKLRGMAQEFRTGFDELARQAELDELKREVDALRRANPLNELRQPINDLRRDFNRPLATATGSTPAAAATATAAPAALPPLPADPALEASTAAEEAPLMQPLEAPRPAAESAS
jgi:sec-independent protein translocase protein TatB